MGDWGRCKGKAFSTRKWCVGLHTPISCLCHQILLLAFHSELPVRWRKSNQAVYFSKKNENRKRAGLFHIRIFTMKIYALTGGFTGCKFTQ